jgi:hypothetical protein
MNSPIDVFVTYDEKKAQDIAISRYATRHLIAAEVRSLNHLHVTFLTVSDDRLMLKSLSARRKHLRRSAKRSHPVSSIGERYNHAADIESLMKADESSQMKRRRVPQKAYMIMRRHRHQ